MKNGLDTAKNEPQVVAKTIARIFKNSKKAAFCLCQFSQIKKIIIYPQLRRPRTFSPWSIFSRPSWSCWRRSGPRRCANVLSNSCNSAILQSWINLARARSLLYRRQILQVNTRWKALDESYKMHMLLHRSDLNISENVRQTSSRFFTLLALITYQQRNHEWYSW